MLGDFTYLGVLVFILIGSGWLEFVLRARVFARWRRWLLAILPGVVLFVAWDLYAIARGHWGFDGDQMTGVVLPGSLPLEELLFFIVVPTAALLTLEAVRSMTGWRAGDEPADEVVP